MHVSELIEILEECDPDSEVVIVVGWTPTDHTHTKSESWTHSLDLRRIEVREGTSRELSDDEFNEVADNVAEAWGVERTDVIDDKIRQAASRTTTGLIAGEAAQTTDAPVVMVRGW